MKLPENNPDEPENQAISESRSESLRNLAKSLPPSVEEIMRIIELNRVGTGMESLNGDDTALDQLTEALKDEGRKAYQYTPEEKAGATKCTCGHLKRYHILPELDKEGNTVMKCKYARRVLYESRAFTDYILQPNGRHKAVTSHKMYEKVVGSCSCKRFKPKAEAGAWFGKEDNDKCKEKKDYRGISGLEPKVKSEDKVWVAAKHGKPGHWLNTDEKCK